MPLTNLFVLIILFSTQLTWACLHYSNHYPTSITEHKKEFVFFEKNGIQHLIAKTNVSSEKELPERLAWIFPVPALPLGYEEVSPKIFEELFDELKEETKGGSLRSFDESNHFKVHTSTQVGRYTIKPIEITQVNQSTGSLLDQWLKQNNFRPMPAAQQQRYLKKGAVFLVIEANLKALKSADFKPLLIKWKSQGPYELPLNFTHEGRSYDVDFYTLNAQLQNSSVLRLNFERQVKLPTSELSEFSKVTGSLEGTMRRYSGHWTGSGEDPKLQK